MAAAFNEELTGTLLSPFTMVLLKISNQLTEPEVGKLKYLCKDHISASDLENASEGYRIFHMLEKAGKLSDDLSGHRFLKQLLHQLERADLIKVFMTAMKKPGPHPQASGLNQAVSDFKPHPLKPPVHYSSPSPLQTSQAGPHRDLFAGIPKPARSLSEGGKASSLQTVHSADGRPPNTSGNEQVFHSPQVQSQKSFPGYTSSKRESKPLASDQITGSPYGSTPGPKGALSASTHQSQNNTGVEKLMVGLSLKGSAQQGNGNVGVTLEEENVETDSPSLVQDQASRPRPLSTSAGASGNQQRPAAPPLVDLSTDSPAVPRQLSREVQSPPEAQSPLEAAGDWIRLLEEMMNQQEAREEARDASLDPPTLRKYQKELAVRPLRKFENHIICAPTGSGKTLTAAYICYQYWNWFRREVSHKHFKTLFIVNMRHLTQQQRDAFQKYFPEKRAVRTIRDQQTFADALKINEEMPAVLMLTAQIFVNALKSREVNIKDLDMLIFDECHHTDLKHPYNEIMKMYLKTKKALPRPPHVGVSGAGLPFVIGLSASLGVGGGALNHLLTLSGNMDAKGVVRVLIYKDELQRHVNAPTEDTIKQVSPRAEHDRQFGDFLKAIMLQIEDEHPDIEGNPLPSCGSQLYESETKERQTKAEESGNRTAVIVYTYLYEYNRALMLYDDLRAVDGLRHLERFHDYRQRSANLERVQVEDLCIHLFQSNLSDLKRLSSGENQHSNEKLGELAFLLNGIFTDNPNSKGIVLVRMKVATTAIQDFIKKSALLQALPCRVFPLRFVGQGDIEDGCMTEFEQKTVLENFRDKNGCNVLVATDIAQEGLDMPACNFVIRYNFVSNEIGTVQSKGRARAEGSQCFLIVESDSLNERREMDNRTKVRKMEEAMDELEAMPEGDRLDKINERQIEILEKIRREEEESQTRRTLSNLDEITVHCKECSALVCKASELRRKGVCGHVTCISPNFKGWVREFRYNRPQRFRDTETVGLISCGTSNCPKQFGTIQRFLRLNPPDGYALKAESFKVHFLGGSVKALKKWNKAGFEIEVDDSAPQ